MNKRRVAPVLLALAFLALAGCKTSGEPVAEDFYTCGCGNNP
jgi:predicted lipoprotein